ncbi:MAG: DUF5686 family protein, partial [Luteibaculum sp.]
MKKILCALSILFSSLFACCQYQISGIVRDSSSGAPMAFVHILSNNQQQGGATTDIDGNFTIRSSQPISSLSASFVGYKTQQIAIGDRQKTVSIVMAPTSLQLAEVEILPGENPAHRMIEAAVENRKKNNPENLPGYSCTVHFKLHMDIEPQDSTDKAYRDSTFGNSFLFLTESISERYHKQPEKLKEKVIATRVSGFKDPKFASLVTELQPFAFYETYIPIYEAEFLNPISPNSTTKYLFNLRDTLYDSTDSTFVIEFKPRKGKNFSGLKGVLYINKKNWAIRNVIAEPFEPGLLHFKIQQQYQLYKDSIWFPDQLNFNLTAAELDMVGVGNSRISKVVIGEPDKKQFDWLETELVDSAGKRSEEFWQKERLMPLSGRDSSTYQLIDSIGEIVNFDRFMQAFEALDEGKIKLGTVDVSLRNAFGFNQYEGTRLGLGLYTGDKISKYFSIGGYYAYGFKDKEGKYGAAAEFKFSKLRQATLKFTYSSDLRESGKVFLNPFYFYRSETRSILASNMARFTGYGAQYKMRLFRDLQLAVSAGSYRVFNESFGFPTQTENFIANANGYSLEYTQLDFRYSYKEKLVEVFGKAQSYGSKYPSLYGTIVNSASILQDNNANFTQYLLRIEDDFDIRNLGTSYISVLGGYQEGNTPAELSFTGMGSKSNLYINTRNHFQSMTPYEFLNQRYVYVFL